MVKKRATRNDAVAASSPIDTDMNELNTVETTVDTDLIEKKDTEGKTSRIRKTRMNPVEFNNSDVEEDVDEDAGTDDEASDHSEASEASEKKVKRSTRSKKKEKKSVNNDLFEALAGPSTLLSSLVRDWLQDFKENSTVAVKELVVLLFQTSGYEKDLYSLIDDETLVDSDLISPFVQDLEGVEDDLVQQVLLGRKKKFQQQFKEFFVLLGSMASDLLLLDSDEFSLIPWLSAMSCSPFRPFRHTATYAALAFLDGLAGRVEEMDLELESLGKQKGKAAAESRSATLTVSKNSLSVVLSDLFTVIFVHR